MEQRDYDSRTALHVAAAEGKTSQTAFIALKPRPWPSVTTLVSPPSLRTCCLQDTWGPCASSWMFAEWTRFPKTGEPTFTGTCRWSEGGLQRCRPGHRWGNTPLDEAMHFCHHDVADILRQCQDTGSPPFPPLQPGGKNLGTFSWQQNDHLKDPECPKILDKDAKCYNNHTKTYYSTFVYIFRNRSIVSYHDIHHFITLWQIKPDVNMFMKC